MRVEDVPSKLVLLVRVPPPKTRRLARRVEMAEWPRARPLAHRLSDTYP